MSVQPELVFGLLGSFSKGIFELKGLDMLLILLKIAWVLIILAIQLLLLVELLVEEELLLLLLGVLVAAKEDVLVLVVE